MSSLVRPRRFVQALVPLALLVTSPSGCPSDEPARPPAADEFVYDCNNAPDGGTTTVATDESFVAIVNAEAATGLVTDDRRAPVLAAPPAGSAISASTPPRFELRPGTAAAPARRPRAALASAVCPPRRSPLAAALAWLDPIAVAHAHCPAVTGDNFLFRLQAGKQVLYTAVLSVTSFTPDRAKWQGALGGRVGSTVTLTLARAFLLQGTVIEGPYVGSAPITFVVER
jgi:hypothetical protein